MWFTYVHANIVTDVGSSPLEQAPNVSQPEIVQSVPTPKLDSRNLSTRPIWEAPPRTKKMPRLKTFRLTKELVQERVKDNIVIVTFGNYAFMDFILTWVKHLTDLGLSNLLIGKKLHMISCVIFVFFLVFWISSTFVVPFFLLEKNVVVVFMHTLREFNLMAQVQWTPNCWRLCIGKVFQYLIWAAIWAQ